MLRHDDFLERVHRLLAIPGIDALAVGRAIDSLLGECGDLLPLKIHAWAQALQIALVRGGVLSARAELESIRVVERAPRTSGVFEGPLFRGRSPSMQVVIRGRVVTVRHRLLMLERDDEEKLQLLCLDGPTPVPVGGPRHARFVHYVYQVGDAKLLEGVKASGSDAGRSERVFDESRRLIGHEWFAASERGGSPGSRIIRIRAHVAVPGAEICERRVRALTEARRAT